MGARRFRALFTNLPPGSAIHRRSQGEAWSWTSTEELLAVQAELLDAIARILLKANGAKRDPKPLSIERPVAREARKTGTTMSELLAMVEPYRKEPNP